VIVGRITKRGKMKGKGDERNSRHGEFRPAKQNQVKKQGEKKASGRKEWGIAVTMKRTRNRGKGFRGEWGKT